MFASLTEHFPVLAALAPIAGWLGLGGGIVVGALAVAIFLPASLALLVPNLRKVCLIVAAIVATATILYGKGVHDGSALVQARWDAREEATREHARGSRAAAEREIPKLDADDVDPAACEPAPAAGRRKPAPRRLFPNDSFNRDNK